MPAKLTFLGHSAALIESGPHKVLIDPFLTGNPQASVAAEEVQCTHIALTHGHADHFGDTPEIAKRTGATVYAPYEICDYLEQEHGVTALERANPGGEIETDFGFIAFTRAIHSSSYEGRYMGVACGIIVRISGHSVYHAGDTSVFTDMRLIGDLYTPEVALLPAGGRFTMGPTHAAHAAELIRPNIAVPIHYGTWPLLTDDIALFKPQGVQVRALKPGESLDLG